MNTYHLETPLKSEELNKLVAGDQVLLSGVIYMARDAAHKRLINLLEKGQDLPIDLKGQVIFYGGPGPTKPGHVIGVVAPTSAYRMDPYAPALFDIGVKATIGKGNRSDQIKASCIKNEAVCFSAIGGISATLFSCIKSSEVVAYPDLRAEAIQRLLIKDMPLLVTIDTAGIDMYEQEVKKYKDILR